MPAELVLRKKPLAVSFAGCGVQLNHNVFAPQTIEQGVPEASFADLKNKVRKLEPQLVRIFYNDNHAGVPFDDAMPQSAVNVRQDQAHKERWDSFVSVVQLAQDAGATINITWQGGDAASDEARKTNMTRFANVLHILVKLGISRLRWVTIANEPNTVPDPDRPSNITPATLADMYRRLDHLLEERGVRKQIGLMGGDVIEGPRVAQLNRLHQPSPFNQLTWLRYMSAHLGGVIDAYSVHIYWDYFDVPKIKRRLDGVLRVIRQLDKERHLTKPMRVYVTEFGTRGKDIDKDRGIDPGRFHDADGSSMRLCETNIAAFQHAWFVLYAAQLGYAGVVKWDCYYGRYDLIRKPKAPPKGNQQYFAIDKPPAGKREWQLLPMYFLLRLLTVTTERGWQVRVIDPSSGSKRLVAFQGAGKNLTILGLHIGGAGTNKKSSTQVSYTIGGLPPRTSFQLLLWNQGGGGGLVRMPAPIVADAGGEAKVTAPLHSVFALTTKALPAKLV
jgi:hypothetical protein